MMVQKSEKTLVGAVSVHRQGGLASNPEEKGRQGSGQIVVEVVWERVQVIFWWHLFSQ